VKMTRTTHFYL